MSAVREPLSFALGTQSKVACLRLLSLLHEPLTQREVARRAEFQHRTMQLALDELVGIGIVSRIEGGRDFLVHLNHEHRLAPVLKQLFLQEAEHFIGLRRHLLDVFASQLRQMQLLALIIFGSVARGDDTSASDLDVLLIASGEGTRDTAQERIEAAREGLRARFGVRVRPIIYTLPEARRAWRGRLSPLLDAYRDGIVLSGQPLSGLLNGKS